MQQNKRLLQRPAQLHSLLLLLLCQAVCQPILGAASAASSCWTAAWRRSSLLGCCNDLLLRGGTYTKRLCCNKVFWVHDWGLHCCHWCCQLWVVIQHLLKYQVPHVLLCQLRILKVELKGRCKQLMAQHSTANSSLSGTHLRRQTTCARFGIGPCPTQDKLDVCMWQGHDHTSSTRCCLVLTWCCWLLRLVMQLRQPRVLECCSHVNALAGVELQHLVHEV